MKIKAFFFSKTYTWFYFLALKKLLPWTLDGAIDKCYYCSILMLLLFYIADSIVLNLNLQQLLPFYYYLLLLVTIINYYYLLLLIYYLLNRRYTYLPHKDNFYKTKICWQIILHANMNYTIELVYSWGP